MEIGENYGILPETIGFLGLQVLTHDSILLTHMELRVYSDILHNMYNSLLEIQ